MTSDDHAEPKGRMLPETLARTNGLSYLFIPATDVQVSGDFYAAVFGWNVDEGRPSHRGFQDGTGHVAGAFDTGIDVAGERGLLPWVYVDDLDETLGRIREHGGEVVREPAPEGNLRVARFRDPAGNVLGLWKEEPSG